MTTTVEKLYRGKILPKNTFYLAATLATTTLGTSTLITSDLEINPEAVFLLCLNKTNISGIDQHRFYWSNDPDDFVPNLTNTALNQGTPEFFYEKNNNYQLFYKTSLNSKVYNNTVNQYALSDDSLVVPIDGPRFNNFNFNYIINNNNNMKSSVYTSIPYNITGNNTNSNLLWNFRKNYTTGAIGPSFSTLPSSSSYFEKLKSKNLNFTGASYQHHTNSIGGQELDINSLTATPVDASSDIPTTNGIIEVTEGSVKEYITYSVYNDTTKTFVIDKRGYLETSQVPFTGTIDINIPLRNHNDNFRSIEKIITEYQSKADTNPILNVFFIPTVDFSYLADGNNIGIINNYFTNPATNIMYRKESTGISFKNALGNRVISFFTNAVNNTLPNNFNINRFNTAHPLIPVYDPGTAAATSSVVIFTSRHEGQSAYYYSYCKGDDICGNCMGVTENEQYDCHTHSNTKEVYKNPADYKGQQPLTKNPRENQKTNIFKNNLIPILISISFIALVIVFSLYILLGQDKKTRNDFEKLAFGNIQ